MKRRGEPLTGYRHICPICGADFRAFGDWSYVIRPKGQNKKIYYCTWKCVRKAEEIQKAKKEAE